ncbi:MULTISPECIES: nitroreductase family protein [unclassified Burkholderia]|uniref:Acg family FMN-binding oxidoreductase n=1 Tax=unclassified Burkholderia TaxID=2613784 RepID=UPI00084C93AF|nr:MULTISPECIES: nitroreductase family protein [unclassified Burkholderia]RQU17656.1 nitroreductase [Burkholderia cenocepacia]MBR8235939.1 nitroreductase family protein [Burkholderia sp. AU32357]MBY4871877.1 nitroreductase family protein [Burkholderia sp. AU42008]OED11590.1 nitroreductase [Burkholderia sp. A2]OXI37955.1 nitroreductase [Burkholderia sp. AU17457]
MISVPPLAASAHVDDQLKSLLAYAVLAPSSHNSQPWRFIVNGATIAVCADRVRALPVVDPFDRELIISCGAALLNLRVALDHAGLAHTISTFPSEVDPDLLALVRVCDDGYSDPSLGGLFDAIQDRVTTRAPFESTAVPDEIQRELIAAGVAEGAEVACIDSTARRARVAELVAQADQQQFADPRFRRELASWIDPRRRVDGMPAFAAGVPTLLDFAAPVVTMAVRTFDLGNGLAALHHQLVGASPLIVCLSTVRDDREAWLAAGQALERILLVAARAGYTASYLNQPIETAALRADLGRMLGLHGEPQLLLRVGRGPHTPHSPRRPLGEVIS